jgi:formylglycine-generating enzyme required for sulfatase activity
MKNPVQDKTLLTKEEQDLRSMETKIQVLSERREALHQEGDTFREFQQDQLDEIVSVKEQLEELEEDWWNLYHGIQKSSDLLEELRDRVLRGGYWYNPPRGLRSARRDNNTPTDRSGAIGFRIVRTKK